MDGNISTTRSSHSWEILPWSKEYRGLPTDVRAMIDGYLTEYPVRLGAIAKQLGVKVLLSTLPGRTSGQIGKEDGEFVIRINRHEVRHRQRFTLAHELAHLLLHRDRIEADGGWSENVLLRAPNQSMKVEYEANRLASDLVIPPALLGEVMADHIERPITSEKIEELARDFGVSVAVMEIKLQIM